MVKDTVFLYDEASMIGMIYTIGGVSNKYFFNRNLQGDVTEIYDTSGSIVVQYFYDAWGNCTYSGDAVLAKANAIRYRGYYYDEETGLYYLNARYYNPKWRRFISPASASSLNLRTVGGLNLYAYGQNNPVQARYNGTYTPLDLGSSVHASTTFVKNTNSPQTNVIDSTASPSLDDPSNIVAMVTTTVWRMGNLSHSVTNQINRNAPLYLFVNQVDGETTTGWGYDFGKVGANVYRSSSGVGFNSNLSWLNGGLELKFNGNLVVSVGASFGDTSGDFSYEINKEAMQIVACTLAVTACILIVASIPIPSVKGLAAATACFIIFTNMYGLGD